MASRDSQDCLYVWEGTTDDFHRLAGSYSNSPRQWSWISRSGLRSLDFSLGDVHEKLKVFVRKRAKPEWSMEEGTYLGWWTWWGQNGRGCIGNEWKKAHDKK